METWEQMSEDALRAAESLLQEGRYRSSVSRSYYAAYCAATGEIVKKLTTFAHGWKNPAHEKVPVYIQSNLTLAQTKKDAVEKLLRTLRLFRENADYRPHEEVDEQIARDCIRDAAEAQQIL